MKSLLRHLVSDSLKAKRFPLFSEDDHARIASDFVSGGSSVGSESHRTAFLEFECRALEAIEVAGPSLSELILDCSGQFLRSRPSGFKLGGSSSREVNGISYGSWHLESASFEATISIFPHSLKYRKALVVLGITESIKV